MMMGRRGGGKAKGCVRRIMTPRAMDGQIDWSGSVALTPCFALPCHSWPGVACLCCLFSHEGVSATVHYTAASFDVGFFSRVTHPVAHRRGAARGGEGSVETLHRLCDSTERGDEQDPMSGCTDVRQRAVVVRLVRDDLGAARHVCVVGCVWCGVVCVMWLGVGWYGSSFVQVDSTRTAAVKDERDSSGLGEHRIGKQHQLLTRTTANSPFVASSTDRGPGASPVG